VRQLHLGAADRMKGSGLTNDMVGFALMSRFQIYSLLNDLSPYEVLRDSTTFARPLAGWPNLIR
jgi:hypothetical protein